VSGKPGLKPSLWDEITPLGESRGGTPEGERALQGACRIARCGGCGPAFFGVPLPFISFLLSWLAESFDLQSMIVTAAGATAGAF
jgi:hypothetical protein